MGKGSRYLLDSKLEFNPEIEGRYDQFKHLGQSLLPQGRGKGSRYLLDSRPEFDTDFSGRYSQFKHLGQFPLPLEEGGEREPILVGFEA